MSTFQGVEGLLAFNIEKVPNEMFKLLNIPQELINEDFENSPLIQKLKGVLNQGGDDAANDQSPAGAASPQDVSSLSQPGQMGGTSGG